MIGLGILRNACLGNFRGIVETKVHYSHVKMEMPATSRLDKAVFSSANPGSLTQGVILNTTPWPKGPPSVAVPYKSPCLSQIKPPSGWLPSV